MVRVLSVDIGIVNFAYAIFDVDGDRVRLMDWTVVDIRPEAERCSAANRIPASRGVYYMVRWATEQWKDETFDFVVVENQHADLMKCVAAGLQSYCIIRGWEHVSYSPKLKLRLLEAIDIVQGTNIAEGIEVPSTFTKYDQNKKLGILHTRVILDSPVLCVDGKQSDYFDSVQKKDDLADALLQGLFFIIVDVQKRTNLRKIQYAREKSAKASRKRKAPDEIDLLK